MPSKIGVPIYQAPELFLIGTDLFYTYQVDSYAFGILLYQILTDTPAIDVYPNDKNITEILKMKMDNFLPNLIGLNEVFVNLIQSCWNVSIETRPDPITIYQSLINGLESIIQQQPIANIDEVREYINSLPKV